MQQPRQLYGLGSLVKKITRPIKKIVKSPIGKVALGAAALKFGGPTLAKFLGKDPTGFLSGRFTGDSGILSAVKGLFGKDRFLGSLVRNKDQVFSPGKAALLGLGGLGIAAPFFFGKEEEEIVEDPFSVTPSSIADIRQMARNRDPSLAFLPQAQFVQPGFYAAEGGRAQLAGGGGRIQQLITLMRDAMDKGDKDTADTIRADIFKEFGLRMNKGGIADLNKPKRGLVDEPGSYAGMKFSKDIMREYMANVKEGYKGSIEDYIIEFYGEDFLDPAFKEGGIASLPKVRMLEGGMPEIDYRQSGGFVPVGKKEKADDVPAMLSKNEFVMTADAVRGMGDGNVEKGAQRMYNQMKQLENRVV
jgi:hypothetical protein